MTSLTNFFFRLSNKEKMLFARNLEIMIGAGLQLIQSLEILKRQTQSKTFIIILDQIISDVKNGHSLSMSLERYPQVFGDFFVNLIRVGEASGTLSENLKYLGEELKKRQDLQNKIRSAMIYPIIILVATLGLSAILMFFIFPKVLPIFGTLGVELPLVTRVFIQIAEFMLAYGVLFFVGMFAALIGFILLLRIKKFRYYWHVLILKTPFVGTISRHINIISFARTISLFLKSGIKIVEAIEMSAGTLPNLVYAEEFKHVAEAVRKGEPISKYMSTRPHIFPTIFMEMITVGDTTGKLDETALFLANFFEEELDESTKTLSSVLEPLLLLFMGLVVSFVAIAIITPIYSITQKLGR